MVCCGPQGEGDGAIAANTLAQAVVTMQVLSGSSLLPWHTLSCWLLEVFCLRLVLNFFSFPLGSITPLPVFPSCAVS